MKKEQLKANRICLPLAISHDTKFFFKLRISVMWLLSIFFLFFESVVIFEMSTGVKVVTTRTTDEYLESVQQSTEKFSYQLYSVRIIAQGVISY